MSDIYDSFAALQSAEPASAFRIGVKRRASPILVLAIHGGAIEPGTSEIAVAIGGDNFNVYLFEGMKPAGNSALHVTSNKFDEPTALSIISESDIVVSVHGCAGAGMETYLGGADQALAARVGEALRGAGFAALRQSRLDLQGLSPQNICNRGRTRRGLQLEITRGLRDKLRSDADYLRAYAASIRRGAQIHSEQG